jgi:hypothetical protein
MKKILLAATAIVFLLSSCEVEVRDGHHYNHAHGWEHRNHPDHHEAYNGGYHHDSHGNEMEHHDH